MTKKRPPSPSLIPNPFIKKKNLKWTLDPPSATQTAQSSLIPPPPPTTADIESGSAIIDDHLSHFKDHLSKHIITPSPLLSIQSYASIYSSNIGNPEGAHFVIHQQDHPIAGTHYDLRLQINETSSASWAIMYGLPGDPNSIRLNRNVTETRIHCLWNHLIETASLSTGSLLIWDTGTYTILPRRNPYVLNLRLTKSEDAAGRAKSGRASRTKRRRRGRGAPQPQYETSDEGESEDDNNEDVPMTIDTAVNTEKLPAMEREIRELEDEQVRLTNAYPGASNTIGSVHQRRWYVQWTDRPVVMLRSELRAAQLGS
ncbi:LigD-N domain-containing protein [Fusarium sp. LHS14.1]|nr:LigD-N domain-containing protein [Fusarium sp. LHS14.1]